MTYQIREGERCERKRIAPYPYPIPTLMGIGIGYRNITVEPTRWKSRVVKTVPNTELGKSVPFEQAPCPI